MNDIETTISPGDRVDLQEIFTSLSDADKEGKFYITKVLDINEDGNIEVLMPMEKMKLVLLTIDMEYEAYFYCKKGIYTCKVVVTERYKESNLIVAVLKAVSDLKKQQRREYYRYSCVIGMNTIQLSEIEAEAYEEKKNYSVLPNPIGKSVIVDISGGGLRFVSSEKYDTGSLVHCKYMLTVKEETKVYSAVARILTSYPVVNNPNTTEYRGQFVYMPETDREDIIRYIFEEERKVRQRT